MIYEKLYAKENEISCACLVALKKLCM